jgi:hypothetical protein
MSIIDIIYSGKSGSSFRAMFNSGDIITETVKNTDHVF